MWIFAGAARAAARAGQLIRIDAGIIKTNCHASPRLRVDFFLPFHPFVWSGNGRQSESENTKMFICVQWAAFRSSAYTHGQYITSIDFKLIAFLMKKHIHISRDSFLFAIACYIECYLFGHSLSRICQINANGLQIQISFSRTSFTQGKIMRRYGINAILRIFVVLFILVLKMIRKENVSLQWLAYLIFGCLLEETSRSSSNFFHLLFSYKWLQNDPDFRFEGRHLTNNKINRNKQCLLLLFEV